jgi:Uma2 family endonuclease
MNLKPRTGPVTFEEFCLLVKDGQKADLIGGVIYLASPDSLDANSLNGWLLMLVDLFAEAGGLGEVFFSRVAFRLTEIESPEPDIAFVRQDRLHLKQKGYFDGPPDLAVEIVSPDSIDRDYRLKRQQYQEAGVREYWIVDEAEQRLTWFALTPNGEFRRIRPRKGALHSQVLPGFWLRPEWLWHLPRPKKADILAQLLAK